MWLCIFNEYKETGVFHVSSNDHSFVSWLLSHFKNISNVFNENSPYAWRDTRNHMVEIMIRNLCYPPRVNAMRHTLSPHGSVFRLLSAFGALTPHNELPYQTIATLPHNQYMSSSRPSRRTKFLVGIMFFKW